MIVSALLMMLSGAPDAYSNATPLERRGMDAVGHWSACLTRNADDLAASNESADTVADAAMGSCDHEESAVSSAWFPLYASTDLRSADAETEAAVARMKGQFRGKLLARLLRARLPGKPAQ